MKKIIAVLLTLVLLSGSVISSFSNTSNTKFKDNANISEYARGAVNWAVSNKIISGYEDNTFRPGVQMPENNWATILTRYIREGQVPQPKPGEHWATPVYKVAQEYLLPFKGLDNATTRENAINRGDVARTVAAAYGFNLTLEQSVEFMYENEFSFGTNANLMDFSTYGVNDNLLREQAVVFIQRINDLVLKRGGVLYRGNLYPAQQGNLQGLKNGGLSFNISPDWSRFVVKNSETISDVNVVSIDNKPEIRIKTTNPLTHKVMKLPSEDKSVMLDRLVFDFDNAKFDMTNESKLSSNNVLAIDVNNELLKRVRVSQFEVNPFKTRVVLDVNRYDEYRVYYDDVNKEMVISFNPNGTPPVSRGEDRANILNSVAMNYIQNREVLVIEGVGIDDTNVMKLDSPNRLVIDIKNADVAAALNNSKINLNGRVAKYARISQVNPDSNATVARIVIDLGDNIDTNDFVFEISKNKITVYLEKVTQTIVYNEVSNAKAELTLIANQVTNYIPNFDTINNTFTLTVPKQHTSLVNSKIDYNDRFIQSINIVELSNEVKVDIKLQKGVEPRILTSLNSKDLLIEFNRSTTKYGDILIVIDPGHGVDPGAISGTLKMYESHIVLDVAQRLNKMLKDAGFRTYMTREGDTRISIQDRALIANQLNADLFVSIHANSALSESANGIETLYYPSENDPMDSRDNKTVAQIFQNELVRLLQGRDRGIVPKDRIVVVRDTMMPAVLCELGFLSNLNEEAKLATNEYRQKAAEAMFNSIVKIYQ